MEVQIKCPFCHNGFVEEIESIRGRNSNEIVLGSGGRALSFLAPIFLDLMGGIRRSRARITGEEQASSSNSSEENDSLESSELGSTSISNSSPLMHHIIQEPHLGPSSSEHNRERNGRSMILVNPFNEDAIVLQLPFVLHRLGNQAQNDSSSLGNYFIGPGLNWLLQHLAENAPNHYGTPPAQKAAVQSMPTITIDQNLQCPICLEEFEIGGKAKQMPCLHKFHDECIVPWLELHSSCPLCRFQMPCDDSKNKVNGLTSIEEGQGNDGVTTSGRGEEMETRE